MPSERPFWLNDQQWSATLPHLPKNQPGARRVDDRRVISGIVHVLRTGCRWCDVPREYEVARRKWVQIVGWFSGGSEAKEVAMKCKRYSVEQIVAVSRQAEMGKQVADRVRQTGITEQTFYRWKKYAGLESDQVRELKQVRDEDDHLVGGFGDDSLAGGDGADFLSGGAGDDVLYGDGAPEGWGVA